jgi:hypothetical protein
VTSMPLGSPHRDLNSVAAGTTERSGYLDLLPQLETTNNSRGFYPDGLPRQRGYLLGPRVKPTSVASGLKIGSTTHWHVGANGPISVSEILKLNKGGLEAVRHAPYPYGHH